MNKAKFKVEDKVRIVNNINESNNKIGDEGVITEVIMTPKGNYGYRVEVEGGKTWGNWSGEKELELIK